MRIRSAVCRPERKGTLEKKPGCALLCPAAETISRQIGMHENSMKTAEQNKRQVHLDKFASDGEFLLQLERNHLEQAVQLLNRVAEQKPLVMSLSSKSSPSARQV